MVQVRRHHTGASIGSIIPGTGSKTGSEGDRLSDATVRLILLPRRAHKNDVEAFVVSLLNRRKDLPYSQVVLNVAEFLYREELRSGGWAVDIGLFGSSLWVADARRALEEGDGELWEIG
ncbi:MAG: hypothetical protein HY695_24410 [Deltaproteobacteria bacterium]|nr:hypothetical protein [Deltaproteobacteria bacterium]